MNRLPAMSGWLWIQQGFALFRKQPAELSTLFIFYFVLNLLISLVPLFDLLLLFALSPVFSMAFMYACADIERGKRVHPKILFAAMRSPAFKPLLALGTLYLLAFLLAGAATYLFDGGLLWQAVISGTDAPVSDPNAVESMAESISFGSLIYLLLILPLWYAGPLMSWQNMSLGKAIFFSFFSVIRTLKAFIFYLLAWLFISMSVIFGASILLQVLQITDQNVKLLIFMPSMIFLNLIRYCSFYPSYTQVFGVPQLPDDTPSQSTSPE